MDAAAAIREARDRIDTWVRIRPPPLHWRREYDLPSDRGRIPPRLVAWLDKAFPPWRRAGFEFETFQVATRRDAQDLDVILFDGRRQALLDTADQLLQSALAGKLAPEQECVALSLLAYGRTQFLLWMDHHDRPTPVVVWDDIGRTADRAHKVLGAAARGFGTTLPEEDFVDVAFRTSFVLGCVHQLHRAGEDAAREFLFAVGWYASAEQLGLSRIVQDRRADWLQALYSILDLGESPAPEPWAATASILVKDLKVGHYRVRPPFVASRVDPSRGRGLSVQFNESLVGEEWRRAASRLGDTAALLDLVVTDRFLHARVCRRERTRRMRIDLHALRDGDKGATWIVPEGSVLDPSIDPKDRSLSDSADEWHPQTHHSDLFRWVSRFQAVAIRVGEEPSWDYRWTTIFPTPTGEIWRSVYETALAEAVGLCEQEGLRHLIVSPDGSLTAIPHHLLRDPQGRRLGDRLAISYAPNMTGLLSVLDVDALDPARTRFVVVQDPSQSVGWADWECRTVASAANGSARVIEPPDATPARLREECRGAGVLHFTGHATFDWSDPDRASLLLTAGERMGLDDLRGLQLQRGALVFLSACHTGRRGPGTGRSSSRGIVSALIEAGAATVICTLWPVESAAAALVSHWFYRAWAIERQGRLESLRQATGTLREARRSDCEQILGRRIYKRGERPFEDEYYWGAFVLYGAW
jgi:CHAT domain